MLQKCVFECGMVDGAHLAPWHSVCYVCGGSKGLPARSIPRGQDEAAAGVWSRLSCVRWPSASTLPALFESFAKFCSWWQKKDADSQGALCIQLLPLSQETSSMLRCLLTA